MKSAFLFFSFCFILFLPACKNSDNGSTAKISSSTLFAEYYIRYLEEEGQLRAQVSYLEGDSLANAKSAKLNSVFFQGGAMEKRKLGVKGLRYRAERVMKYTPPFNFTYNPENGEASQHNLTMAPIIDFTLVGQLSRSGQTTLQWEGPPLKEQEAMVLIFTDQKNQTAAIDIKGPSEENQVIIKGKDIQKLSPGEIKFYLVKKKKTEEQDNSTVNSSTIEFYTKTAIAKLKD